MFAKFKSLFGAQDMTVGKPMTNLLKFSIPLLIGNVAQQLYSTVDSIVVGKYIGDTALSAVGTTLPVINMVLVLFVAIATGAGIMVAQYFGAKRQRELATSIGNGLTLVFVTTAVISVIAIPFTPQLMRLINTPAETFEMACTYMRIILYGLEFLALYNIISGIMRGLGDSIFPLIVLLITCGINIGLDIGFVAGLKMGVAGVAWATILSQAISVVILIVRLIKMKSVTGLKFHDLMLKSEYSLRILRLGLPAGVQQIIFSLASVFVQALTNSMGYLVVTATTAVMRVDGFAMMPNFTFGMAISTYIGQNIGAGELNRCKRGSKDAYILSLLTSVALVTLIVIFGKYLIMMFTDTGSVIELGIRQLRILAVGYIAMAVMQVAGGIMRGAGDTMPSMWISIISTVIIRTPLAYLLAYMTRSSEWPNGSPDALFFSLLVSWIIGAIASYIWYRRGKWQNKALVKYETNNESVPETQKA